MKSNLSFITVFFVTFLCSVFIFEGTVYGQDDAKQGKKSRKNEFIVYGGVNLNDMKVPEDIYRTDFSLGYHFGAAYKQGKFFYWQIGGRFNNATYYFEDASLPSDSAKRIDNTFSIRAVDIPITGGVNFLSFVNRVVALRLFLSAVPSFQLGVGSNDFGFTKDNLESFTMSGQVGVGVSVAFIVIEAGYNHGFMDSFSAFGSNPQQIFFNLGFRF